MHFFKDLKNTLNKTCLFHSGWFTTAITTTVLELSLTSTGFSLFVTITSVTIATTIDWSRFTNFSAAAVSTWLWFLGTFEGVWHDVFRKMELFTEVSNTFVSESPVVVLPCEVFFDETFRFQGFQSVHHEKITDSSFFMDRTGIFFGDQYTFREKNSPDLETFIDRNNHLGCWLFLRFFCKFDLRL